MVSNSIHLLHSFIILCMIICLSWNPSSFEQTCCSCRQRPLQWICVWRPLSFLLFCLINWLNMIYTFRGLLMWIFKFWLRRIHILFCLFNVNLCRKIIFRIISKIFMCSSHSFWISLWPKYSFSKIKIVFSKSVWTLSDNLSSLLVKTFKWVSSSLLIKTLRLNHICVSLWPNLTLRILTFKHFWKKNSLLF